MIAVLCHHYIVLSLSQAEPLDNKQQFLDKVCTDCMAITLAPTVCVSADLSAGPPGPPGEALLRLVGLHAFNVTTWGTSLTFSFIVAAHCWDLCIANNACLQQCWLCSAGSCWQLLD